MEKQTLKSVLTESECKLQEGILKKKKKKSLHLATAFDDFKKDREIASSLLSTMYCFWILISAVDFGS